MPLIQIRYNRIKISPAVLTRLSITLPRFASELLSCEEGGRLSPQDIMIEADEFNSNWGNVNCKDLHVRVIAHDYPSRRGEKLDIARDVLAAKVMLALESENSNASWYVWVLLSLTSYKSDTDSG